MATFNYKTLATAVAESILAAKHGNTPTKVPAEIMTGILAAAVTENPTEMLHHVITLLGRERERADRAEAELARCQEELQEATRARQAAEESEALSNALEGLGLTLERQQHQAEVAELEQRIDDVVDAGRAAEVENDMLREHVKELENELGSTEAELLDVKSKLRAASRHYHTSPNGTVKLREALAALRTEHEKAQAELTLLRARLAPPVAGVYDSDDELSDVD